MPAATGVVGCLPSCRGKPGKPTGHHSSPAAAGAGECQDPALQKSIPCSDFPAEQTQAPGPLTRRDFPLRTSYPESKGDLLFLRGPFEKPTAVEGCFGQLQGYLPTRSSQ